MPDPREAIYDVLKAKWQRARDAKAMQARQAEWDAYEQANARARDAEPLPAPAPRWWRQ